MARPILLLIYRTGDSIINDTDNSENTIKKEFKMFSSFLSFFNKSVQYDIYGNEYRTFVIAFGGMSFGKGMFNVFDKGDLRYWEKNIIKIFPEYKGKIELFGYDWMGRCFAVNSLGSDDEKILVFDPSAMEVNDIKLSFMEFINKAVPASVNECFSSDAFIRWYNESGTELEYLQCLGNIVPLFLGGADELNNMELSDMDVYWSILGQTAVQIRGMEEGTVIEEFSIEDGNEKHHELHEDDFYANQADEAGEFFELQKKRASYIKKNVDKYLEKFKKMHNKGSKLSWNWCAFLFFEFWFAYRKMYVAAVTIWAIPYVIGAVLGAVLGIIDMDMQDIDIIINASSVVIGLVLMIVVGMFGNHWYQKRIDKLVIAGETAETEEEREKIYKKGGVSGIALAIALVISLAFSLVLELI